jgi:hypothetical protein
MWVVPPHLQVDLLLVVLLFVRVVVVLRMQTAWVPVQVWLRLWVPVLVRLSVLVRVRVRVRVSMV